MQASDSGDTDAIRLATDGIFEFACPSGTWEVGDLVGIFQSGAYARTSSPLGFLSHAAPPEVLVHDGQIELIRRRGDYRGMLEDQTPPDGA